jgi:hypothetical protein
MPPLPPTFLLTVTDLLYLLCSALLLLSAAVIFWRDPRSEPHRHYALTALSLLGWVATLPLYYHSANPNEVLWLGRVNFAAAALAVAFGYLLVRSLARRRDGNWKEEHDASLPGSVITESVLLALLSAFTGLVDRAELMGTAQDARHVTVYGVLFPIYALHVLAYLGASTLAAFQARKDTVRGAARDRLTLVGAGVLITGIVGVVADIILPYGFSDFRFTDAGPLSTAAFLLAVGYAVLRHRLFDLRLLVRRTLVLGVLGSLALAAYGAVVVLATERFAGEGAGTFTRFGVLVIALSFDPLRRGLEKRVDRLLFWH